MTEDSKLGAVVPASQLEEPMPAVSFEPDDDELDDDELDEGGE